MEKDEDDEDEEEEVRIPPNMRPSVSDDVQAIPLPPLHLTFSNNYQKGLHIGRANEILKMT